MATSVVERDVEQVSNGGQDDIEFAIPYQATIRIVGDAPLLMHAYNVEAVRIKNEEKKGSAAKKTDAVDTYVHRDEDGYLGIPGNAFHAALVNAGRYRQDPRSPRKSMMDLVKAAVIPLNTVAPFLPKRREWDYEDVRRVVVQRNAVARTRPAMKTGWEVEFVLRITQPDYIDPVMLRGLVREAGMSCGLLDHRPTYGRFSIARFEVNNFGE